MRTRKGQLKISHNRIKRIEKEIQHVYLKTECICDILLKTSKVDLIHETTKEIEQWFTCSISLLGLDNKITPSLPAFESSTIKIKKKTVESFRISTNIDICLQT